MHLQIRKLFLIFVLLKGARCQAIWGPKEITVMEHEDLTVECGYKKQYENNEKYWCKERRIWPCSVLARTSSSEISRSGLFLSENKTNRVIKIIMKDIQKREGTYWCGISTASTDEHSRVAVKVKKALSVIPTKQQDIITSGIATDNSITPSYSARPTRRNTISIPTGPLLGVWTVLRWILLCVLLSCPILVTCWETWCRSRHLSSQPTSGHLSSQPASEPEPSYTKQLSC